MPRPSVPSQVVPSSLIAEGEGDSVELPAVFNLTESNGCQTSLAPPPRGHGWRSRYGQSMGKCIGYKRLHVGSRAQSGHVWGGRGGVATFRPPQKASKLAFFPLLLVPYWWLSRCDEAWQCVRQLSRLPGPALPSDNRPFLTEGWSPNGTGT